MSKKILIIEDDNIFQEEIKITLEKEGFEVIQSYDGEDGFEKIKKTKPDLVILDLLMPVKPGEWVLKEMNKAGILDKYPLIVLTAKGDMANVDYCLKMGVKNYLFKSDSDFGVIVRKIKEILEIA